MTYKNKEYLKYIEDITSNEKVQKMAEFIQHGSVSTYEHCNRVAFYSYMLAKKLNISVDYRTLLLGAFLHDFYLYDWHESNDYEGLHGFKHPKIASYNAKKEFGLTLKQIQIIESHMWPLTITQVPKSKEAVIVCMVDKYSATIEVLEEIMKKFKLKKASNKNEKLKV
ncbi:HD domain protein [compost metagenome]